MQRAADIRVCALGAFLALYAAAAALARGSMRWIMAGTVLLVPMLHWMLLSPAAWLTVFFAVALLAPPLPVAFGNSGPHPALAIAAIGFALGFIRLSQWRFRRNFLSAAIVVFFAILLISIAPAAIYSGPEIALQSLARVMLAGISFYVFFYCADGPGRSTSVPLSAIQWIAIGSAAFACLDFFYQFPAPAGFGPQFIWLESGVYRRAQGLFYEASTLGNFCAFFLVMIAVCIARPRAETPVSRKALAAGGVLFLAAMVLSYSRASVLNELTALAVLGWLNRKRIRFARLGLILVPGAALAAVVVNRVFPEFVEAYWLRLSASAEYLTTATEGVFSGRIASWRALLEWIAAHPWQAWAGIGYKTLPYTDYLGAPIVGDNMYITLLVETGVLGLAALLWLCIAILRASSRAARSGDPARAFAGTWMLCFWSGQMVQMLSGDLLTYWRVLPLYFWVLALAVRK